MCAVMLCDGMGVGRGAGVVGVGDVGVGEGEASGTAECSAHDVTVRTMGFSRQGTRKDLETVQTLMDCNGHGVPCGM